MDEKYFCSWSGGKDSCLALYYAMKEKREIKYLFTMLNEDGEYSRSHRLSKNLLREQANRIGLPIIFKEATWEKYEASYSEQLKVFQREGITHGIFGDIDIEEHREWCNRICKNNEIESYHPLWLRSRKEMLSELIDLGFTAKLIVVDEKKLGKEWLGKTINREVIEEFEKRHIDICGENGEYHTVVTNGPIFKSELHINYKQILENNGYYFLDLEIGS